MCRAGSSKEYKFKVCPEQQSQRQLTASDCCHRKQRLSLPRIPGRCMLDVLACLPLQVLCTGLNSSVTADDRTGELGLFRTCLEVINDREETRRLSPDYVKQNKIRDTKGQLRFMHQSGKKTEARQDVRVLLPGYVGVVHGVPCPGAEGGRQGCGQGLGGPMPYDLRRQVGWF